VKPFNPLRHDPENGDILRFDTGQSLFHLFRRNNHCFFIQHAPIEFFRIFKQRLIFPHSDIVDNAFDNR